MPNKRHNTICYHQVREAQVAQIIRVAWIPGDMNANDLLTRTIMPANKKNQFVRKIFTNNATVVNKYSDNVDA